MKTTIQQINKNHRHSEREKERKEKKSIADDNVHCVEDVYSFAIVCLGVFACTTIFHSLADIIYIVTSNQNAY